MANNIIPENDNTPMGIIKQTGQFYSKIAERNKHRSSVIKWLLVLFGIVIFILPGLALIILPIYYVGTFHIGLLFPILIGLLFLFAGIKIIRSNLS